MPEGVFRGETQALQSNQRQYLRKITLLVGDAAGTGMDLSALQVRFSLTSATLQTPRRLDARLYNVAKTTATKLRNQFVQVTLSAGYENGPFGFIFGGLIAQVKVGREDAANTFVDIIATDGDFAYNFSVVNATLAAGWQQADLQRVLVQSLRKDASEASKPKGSFTIGYSPKLSESKAPRGAVVLGMTRDHLRQFAIATGTQWHLEYGTVNFVPELGYIPGDAIVLDSASGMIGVPVLTIDGVQVTCLLNPNIKTGRLLKIANASITGSTLKTPISIDDEFYQPSKDPDGIYKVYALRHIGDTRGQEWYTEAICVGQNATLPNTSTFINASVDGK